MVINVNFLKDLNLLVLKDLNLLVNSYSFYTFPSVQWPEGGEIIMTMIYDGMLRILGILNIGLNIRN